MAAFLFFGRLTKFAIASIIVKEKYVPRKEKPMKRYIRLVALLLATVLCLTALVGCSAANKPLKYLKTSLEKTIDRRFGGKLLESIGAALSDGSIALSFGGTDLFDTVVDSAEVTAYFDADDKKMNLFASLSANGETFDGKLYLTDEQMVLSSSAFLGSNTVGFDFEALSADIRNSIFRNDSGTVYAQDDIGTGTADALRDQKDGFFLLLDALGDIYDLGDEIFEIFLVKLAEHAPHSVYKKDGRNIISLEVSNNTLSRALRDTRAAIVDDRGICRDLRRYATTLDEIESAKSGVTTTHRKDELETFLTSDTGVEAACAFIDDAEPFLFKIDASVKRTSRVIETLSVSLSRSDVEVFAFSADLTDDDINHLVLTVGDVRRELTYRVLKDGLFSYEAEMTYRKALTTGEEIFERNATLSSNSRKDSFTFSLDTADGRRVFSGSFDKGFDHYTLSIDAVTVDGVAHKFSFSATVSENDKVEKPPEYVNIFTISEERYATISPRLNEKREAFESWREESGASGRDVLALVFGALGISEDMPPALDEDFDWKNLFT